MNRENLLRITSWSRKTIRKVSLKVPTKESGILLDNLDKQLLETLKVFQEKSKVSHVRPNLNQVYRRPDPFSVRREGQTKRQHKPYIVCISSGWICFWFDFIFKLNHFTQSQFSYSSKQIVYIERWEWKRVSKFFKLTLR